MAMDRTIFTDEHDLFRASFRRFVEREVTPYYEQWEQAGIVPRELFTKAGAHGFLGMSAPTEHGGGGVRDFRYHAIVTEELMYAGHAGVTLCFSTHNDVCLPYLLDLTNDEQKARWLPGVCSGETVLAIAMTEPHAGSDFAAISTTAIRDGDHFVVNGAKTFITNGINADLVITAVKTDPAAGPKGMSVLALERGMDGFERGRNLDKIGLHSQDTAELSFTDVRVPVANVIGTIGDGFVHMMRNLPQERLGLAMAALAGAKAALDLTVAYTKERIAFGQPIAAFQNTKFRLAEMATETEIGQVFIDRCITALNDSSLSAEEAAMAKWWCTELQKRTVDTCLQLHGGYGYMREYAIARAYTDARISTIFGGTTEIMKEIIGRNVIR
jgi:alkylation response protein AidB-like acyl-CoA dehydrogenase